MAVDKDLFLYDLSVVAIMKNEAPYVKEWLDYHLLAGVQHFYIYDNESPDNLKEVLQPYINAGIVTYTFYPGKCRQMEAYIDAVHRFKFFSRYIAFIDGDEFIFPKNNKSIVEVVDEIFNDKPQVCGLAINWQMYGSNFQDTADYSRGVLERFTRRAENPSTHVKTIADPRRIILFYQPHSPKYFENCRAVNENGGFVPAYLNDPPTANRIAINHYSHKSFEECKKKVERGNADHFDNRYDIKNFSHERDNDILDYSILNYRIARQNVYGGGASVRQINYRYAVCPCCYPKMVIGRYC